MLRRLWKPISTIVEVEVGWSQRIAKRNSVNRPEPFLIHKTINGHFGKLRVLAEVFQMFRPHCLFSRRQVHSSMLVRTGFNLQRSHALPTVESS
jgi:hypothetical protein